MKKIALSLCALALPLSVNSCRNTISNNTETTYKVAEIRQENRDLKRELYLPEEYLKDEQKAHTLKPGEEVDFGGHYLPTFAIFKEYPDGKWHSLLIVKQNECGPRGPENKYLLMTDLLRCKLPDDYDPVYTFVRRKLPQELFVESKNQKELTSVKNPYQELQNILDDAMQKIQELMSTLIDKCPVSSKPNAEQPETSTARSAQDEAKAEKDVMEGEDGKTCGMCKV